MSELISGKEALIALANGDVVEVKSPNDKWYCDWGVINPNTTKLFLNCFLVDSYGFQFRLKPRTISINGVEVPAPFEPKEGDAVFVLDNSSQHGFSTFNYNSGFYHVNFGAWRTEEEIKQVVSALRSVFGKK